MPSVATAAHIPEPGNARGRKMPDVTQLLDLRIPFQAHSLFSRYLGGRKSVSCAGQVHSFAVGSIVFRNFQRTDSNATTSKMLDNKLPSEGITRGQRWAVQK